MPLSEESPKDFQEGIRSTSREEISSPVSAFSLNVKGFYDNQT